MIQCYKSFFLFSKSYRTSVAASAFPISPSPFFCMYMNKREQNSQNFELKSWLPSESLTIYPPKSLEPVVWDTVALLAGKASKLTLEQKMMLICSIRSLTMSIQESSAGSQQSQQIPYSCTNSRTQDKTSCQISPWAPLQNPHPDYLAHRWWQLFGGRT